MSYSKYDFRYKVVNNREDHDILRDSLVLEPWVELLRIWDYLDKPNDLLPIFQWAIEYCILSERYSSTQLNRLEQYPEFHEAIWNGLRKVWITYPIRHENNEIIIGESPGNVIFTSDQMYHLIIHIRDSGNCELLLGTSAVSVGIFMVQVPRETYYLLLWLSKKLNKNLDS